MGFSRQNEFNELAAAAIGVTAGVGIAAVAATAAQDAQNGTESSLGDYISNAFKASAEVGGAIVALCLAPYGAEVLTAMILVMIQEWYV